MSVRTHVFFDTPDRVHVVGDYVLPEDTIQGCVVLLHMMPATRASFQAFQEALAIQGMASLAIDLRGHGDSVKIEGSEKALDYRRFSNGEHQKSILDVVAAVSYLCALTSKNVSDCVLMGASIGANLAIQYASQDNRVSFVVALSPGLDYRGIKTLPLIEKINPSSQRVLLAASKGDAYSYDTVQTLSASAPAVCELAIREGFEHGSDMLADNPFALKILRALCNMEV